MISKQAKELVKKRNEREDETLKEGCFMHDNMICPHCTGKVKEKFSFLNKRKFVCTKCGLLRTYEPEGFY